MDLENVQVGDVVIVDKPHRPRKVRRVSKVTKTMIVVDHARYNRKTGRLVGATGWHWSRIKIGTADEITEVINETDKQIMVDTLNFLVKDWNRFPIEKLKEIKRIIEL